MEDNLQQHRLEMDSSDSQYEPSGSSSSHSFAFPDSSKQFHYQKLLLVDKAFRERVEIEDLDWSLFELKERL